MKKEEKIIYDNLSAIFKGAEGIYPRLAYQAHELILLKKAQSAIDIYEASGILQDAYESTKELDTHTLFAYLRALSAVLLEDLSASDIHSQILSLFSDSEELDARALGKVSYLRNKFTEKAFDKFAKHIDDARTLYAGSFEDSCEDVYNGICEYCILPSENSTDGRLSAFYKLIKKYDLHIIASTEVITDEASTTLLLLSRNNDFSKYGEASKGRMLEFEIGCDNSADISGVIEFVLGYGLKLIKILYSGTDNESLFTFLFSADSIPQKHIEYLSFCLSALYPTFTVTGFYKHIN